MKKELLLHEDMNTTSTQILLPFAMKSLRELIDTWKTQDIIEYKNGFKITMHSNDMDITTLPHIFRTRLIEHENIDIIDWSIREYPGVQEESTSLVIAFMELAR